MTRKSRLTFVIAAASLAIFTACSETAPTSPEFSKVRRDAVRDSLIALGCGDTIPWGKAPCADPSN